MHHRAICSARPAVRAAALLGALVGAAWLAGCTPTSSARLERGDALPAHFDAERIEAKRAKFEERGPKRADAPQEAMDFFMEQRLPEGMSVYPFDRVQAAAAEYRARRAQRGAPGIVSSWQEVGPGNIGGRTRAIVVDPTDADILYAAGVAGGVFRSFDGGQSWTPTSDDLANIAVCALVMDPTDPETLYAGTGEGFFNGDAVRGLGIFKTTNRGDTWVQLEGTTEPQVQFGSFFRCNKLAISPNDPDRIYAATRFGVWRSTNAGDTWDVVLANPNFISGPQNAAGTSAGALDLEIRQDSDPDVLLATFGSFDADGLYRSVNGGDTWTKITDPDIDRFDQGRMTIDIAPSDNDIMYICMANNGASAEFGRVVDVFRSTDGGTTWEPRLDGGNFLNPLLLTNIPFASGCFGTSNFSQGWYDNIIKIDPADPDVVWVGGIDLLRSDDGGRNFGIASYWYFNVLEPSYTHADQHELVFHPDYDGVTNQTMWVGSDGGVSRTDNARAATSVNDCPFDGGDVAGVVFTQLNNGYGVTQFYHGEVSTNADLYLGGTQDNGTNFVGSRDDLNGWVRVFGGDGGYVAFDPRDDDRYYLETQNFARIRRTDDGGQSFVNASNGLDDSGLFIVPFVMDKSNPDRLWTGGRRIWRTDDRGDNWSEVGPDFDGPATVSAVAVAPGNPRTVYVGYSDGWVAVSRNATTSSPIWAFPSTGLPIDSSFISSVAVDPSDPDFAYATVATFGGPHVYRSTNGGLNWAPIDGSGADSIPDVPAHWIAIRPGQSNQLFVGTEIGVFESGDTGATWRPAGVGLPTTVCESLQFQDPDTLVVFTHGRGAFVTTLSGEPCSDADLAEPFGILDLSDITTFVSAFLAEDPSADLNPDGLFDLADIVAFVTAFNAGCP